MAALVAALPAYSFVAGLVAGDFSDSGWVVAVVVLAILGLVLAVVFLPAAVAVIGSDPIQVVDLSVFGGALLGAHVISLMGWRLIGETSLWYLVYPVASGLATVVIRGLARRRFALPEPGVG